jgi:hypothetical protein
MNITGIPVDQWNKTADDIYSPYLRVGTEQSVGGGGNLPQGRIVNRGRESSWKHPFTVIPVWDTQMELSEAEQTATGRKRGAWVLTMSPGFVNGHAPAISVPTKVIPNGVQVWGNKYGKETREHARLADSTQVLLTDPWTPYMKVTSFMDSRGDIFSEDYVPAIPIDVPLFFRSIRAMAKPKDTDFTSAFFSMATAGGAFGDNPSAGEAMVLGMLQGGAGPTFVQQAAQGDGFPDGDRYLYFCDVVLQIDRPSTRQIFQPDEFGILRYAGFQIDPPDSGLYNARIYSINVMLIRSKGPTIQEIEDGTYIEPKIDEIPMARVFFLSPSKPMLDDGPITPNGSWMPMVRHEVYWNLSYAALNIYDPFKPNRDLDAFKVLGSVLAGGVAYLIIGSQADIIEAQNDEVSTLMNNTRVRTRFWTS